MPKRKAEPEQVVLTDPRALRALAHPARAAVIDRLFQGGELTATELANLTGLTPSAMSYHLRSLQKWGIVRRADQCADQRADERERPWIRAAKRLSWRSDVASPVVNDALAQQYLGRLREDLDGWDRGRGAWPPEWQELGTLTRGFPLLTAEEVRQLDKLVVDAVKKLSSGRTDSDCPPGAQRVAYFWASVPIAAAQPPA